ncbi:hypothetical protein AB0H42_26480 [Nocardia sp. NPDC050799]|uniref:hypothetical protein n=1 Tax=Nocardia sp. NPDC050799 TaxID=3154842 RepID=UPI0033C00E2F
MRNTNIIRALLRATDHLDFQVQRVTGHLADTLRGDRIGAKALTTASGTHDNADRSGVARLKHAFDPKRHGPTPTNAAVRGGGVSEKDFPLPGRVQDFASPFTEEAAAKVAERQKFSRWQADAANIMVGNLRALGRRPTPNDWSAEYWRLVEERSKRSPLFPDNDRLKKPITDDEPNRDWFGLNIPPEGGVREPLTGQWVGGQPTPLGRAYAEAGERALARFETEGVTGNDFQNTVRLSDGSFVDGNRIARKERLEQISREMAERYAARGFDISAWQYSSRPGDVITSTATETDRSRIIQDAFRQLAGPGEFTTEAWADVAYKLFQGPQMYAGSDAVTRTFLAGAAEYHLGRVPVFPHDIDLRALTMSQRDFVSYIVEHDMSMRGLSGHPDVPG